MPVGVTFCELLLLYSRNKSRDTYHVYISISIGWEDSENNSIVYCAVINNDKHPIIALLKLKLTNDTLYVLSGV